MHNTTTEKLFSFIESSPTAFHAIETMRCRLDTEGYQPLLEGSDWNLQAGGKYYVIRNGSSIIAFRIPTAEWKGFQIMASHSDSPMFKIKENPEMEAEGHYVKLNVEKYGGMLCAPWFDRPLSVAGRLVVKEGNQIVTKLVDVKKDLVMIPSLAIHMNRDANNGVKFNPQKDLLPLYGDETAKGTFMARIAELAGVTENDILAHDLYVYSRTPGSVWGASKEYISCGRLDDLQCAFSSLEGFLHAKDGESIPLHCVFDNEEVGSSSKQGAASTLLYDTLRIVEVSRNSDNCFCYFFAQVVFCIGFHLLQDHSGNLLWRIFFVIDGYFVISTHMSFNRRNCFICVGYCLTFCRFTYQSFSCFCKCYNRWCCSCSFCISDNGWFSTFHNSYTAVCCS